MRVLILRGLMIAMLALAVSNGVAFAGPREDAQAAYNRGDYATALQLLMPLVAGGDAGAQTTIGWIAAHGNGAAQATFGWMLENGQGVPKDEKEAIKWYLLAAEQGVVSAQINLGLMYETGRGVPQDYDEAFRWYRRAAAQGDAVATV
jgi:uncharacterized protein